MKEGRGEDCARQSESSANSKALFDHALLFQYLERIAVAIESRSGQESHEQMVDRAIGLLHRVGFSRRAVARELGVTEGALRGKNWSRFNKVLNDGQGLQRGLDAMRLAEADKNRDDQGEDE